jgi:hypothetical protein
MFKLLGTYIRRKNIYKMQHLEGSGTPVLYIDSRILKGLMLPSTVPRAVGYFALRLRLSCLYGGL